MKRFFLLLISLSLLLFSCSAETDESERDSFEAVDGSSSAEESVKPLVPVVTVNEIGTPFSEEYSEFPKAIQPSDMIVYDGYLYMGCGDYTDNRGPVNMWRYSLAEKVWEISGTVPDEAVHRFKVIDGKLMAPGIDPRSDWSMGNFYVLEDGKWVVKHTVTNSIHCFDLERADGKLFAAIDCSNGIISAAVSSDGGESFVNYPLLKDGKTQTGDIHYYDILNIGDKIYALFNADLYEYTGHSFERIDSLFYALRLNPFFRVNFSPIIADEELNGKNYFVTGYLYACTSPDDLHYIKTPDDECFRDIYKYDGKLYCLSVAKNKGSYINSVYEIKEESAEKLFLFEHSAAAMTFSVYENEFYFGMMTDDFESFNENNGKVIEVVLTYE